MVVPIPYVHAGIGLLIVVISIPLIMRKVGMNHLYGVRMKKAFVSDGNWYDINAYGGKCLLSFGLFLLAFSYLTKDVAPPPTSLRAMIFFVLPLIALAPVLLLIHSYARNLPDQ